MTPRSGEEGRAEPGPERLGVLGGTFDPVHFGHLAAAEGARQALHLDRVLLVVAARPWQKSGRVLAPAEDRLAMVEAAVAGCEGLEASRLELDREGETYTVDTLEALVNAGPVPPELFLVVGPDVAGDLESWHRASAVARLCRLVVVDRPGAAPPALSPVWDAVTVEVPQVDASSSEVRRRLAAGLTVEHLVPREVVNLIRSRDLYSGGSMTRSGDE